MVREYALLSIIFSDILTFHITKTRHQFVMPLIKAIFEAAICLFSKMNPRMYVISPLCSKPDSRNLDASVNQTLLLTVVSESPFDSDEYVQDWLVAELRRIWVEQSKPPAKLTDCRLYDYFSISFIAGNGCHGILVSRRSHFLTVTVSPQGIKRKWLWTSSDCAGCFLSLFSNHCRKFWLARGVGDAEGKYVGLFLTRQVGSTQYAGRY